MVESLAYLFIGALMGLLGQILRIPGGIKKELDVARPLDQTWRDWFNGRELGVTLLLGAGAGMAAALIQFDADIVISKKLLMGFVAAGYAGSDFLSSFMGKWLNT